MVLGLPRPSLCAWFSLTRLPTVAARKLFMYHILKETALSFVFCLLRAPVDTSPVTEGVTLFKHQLLLYSMPRQDFFVPYLLPSHVKYYPNSQNFPPF